MLAAMSATAGAPVPRSMAEVLAAAVPEDWRSPDPENTLYLELDAGRVVIELGRVIELAPRDHRARA
jgi:peptidylprolyl isomerase